MRQAPRSNRAVRSRLQPPRGAEASTSCRPADGSRTPVSYRWARVSREALRGRLRCFGGESPSRVAIGVGGVSARSSVSSEPVSGPRPPHSSASFTSARRRVTFVWLRSHGGPSRGALGRDDPRHATWWLWPAFERLAATPVGVGGLASHGLGSHVARFATAPARDRLPCDDSGRRVVLGSYGPCPSAAPPRLCLGTVGARLTMGFGPEGVGSQRLRPARASSATASARAGMLQGHGGLASVSSSRPTTQVGRCVVREGALSPRCRVRPFGVCSQRPSVATRPPGRADRSLGRTSRRQRRVRAPEDPNRIPCPAR